MKHVEKISLVFENTEYIDVFCNEFGVFVVDDMSFSIERVAINSVVRRTFANFFAIEIFDTCYDKDYFPFGIETEKQLIKDRLLACSDIVCVEIFYEDGTSETIFVHWSDKSDDFNEYQKTILSENGNLYIVISQQHSIEDVFSEEIENVDYSKEIRHLIT